jgi:penicillin-binding protein 1A
VASSGNTKKLPVVKKRRLKPWLRWALFLSAAGIILGVIGVIGLFLVFAADPDLPRISAVGDYHPKVVTKVYASDGTTLIGEIYEERRTVVPRDKIPPVMIHAIVDAEDADFYQHSGLSYWGMFRALVDDLRPGARMRGASTLTQQLVRKLILKNATRSGMAGVKRKLQEMILAKRLETRLSKDEILYLYLNEIDFPYLRFGVEEASRFYFGKSVSDIDAGEAALLASLPKGPSEIDPWTHPERAKERQHYVLSQMVRYGHLKEADAKRFADMPFRLVKQSAPELGIAPEFVDEVKKVLRERYGAQKLATLGVTVTTTCDARIQKLAREAVEKGLVDLDGRQGYRKPLAHLKDKALDAHVRKLSKEFPSGPGREKIVEGVVTKLAKDGAEISLGVKTAWLPLPTAIDRYNPKALPPEKRFAVGDVLRVRIIDAPKDKLPILSLELGPQAAAVVIDPETREVKAIVGGYGFHPGNFNHARDGKRQPGS